MGYAMKIGRLPVYFLIVGTVFKAVLVALWRLYQPAEIYGSLIKYDPIGIWLAETVTPLFFDPRRLAPKPSEAIFYEVVLVITFAIECFVLGLVLQMAIRRICKNHDANLKPSVS
jgi:hypothetical protein